MVKVHSSDLRFLDFYASKLVIGPGYISLETKRYFSVLMYLLFHVYPLSSSLKTQGNVNKSFPSFSLEQLYSTD